MILPTFVMLAAGVILMLPACPRFPLTAFFCPRVAVDYRLDL
jgi:hypothetical protein